MIGEKILFITPPYHCGVVEVAGRWMPLTFAYLAGAVREAGFEPLIYDAMTKRHDFNEIEKKIREIKPDFVATSAITSSAPDALEVLRIAKEINTDIITIIGGVHPTFLYHEILLNGSCDYVVRGEGEETIVELINSLHFGISLNDIKGIAYKEGHRIIATPERTFIQDLDNLEPAWDLIEWQDYRYFVIPGSRLGAVSTSRGCNHNCTFCSQQKFWKQAWRGRRPENVVEEIKHLYNTFGVNVYLLPDEYPTKSRERWERILDLIIEKGMDIYILMETRAEDIIRDKDILHKYRKAGVIHIYIGIEATNQDTLDLIKKDIVVETGIEAIRLIHKHGMITETSFILGFPNETQKSISRTLKISKYYNPDFAHYLALAPWPYADMYKEVEPYIEVKDYRKYNLIDPVIKPEKMSIEEIDRAIIDCYQKFYMGKLNEILTMKDVFKKRYLLYSMKLIMNSSFIVDKMGSLGRIPSQVKNLMNKLEKNDSSKQVQTGKYISKVSRSIVINSPVKDVFKFVTSPLNWPEYINGLQEIKNASNNTPVSGTTFDWIYRIRGINLKGKGEIVEYDKDKKFVLQMHSLMPIKKILHFHGDSEHTVLTVEVGFQVPGKVLSFLYKLIMNTVNVMQADTILRKLKSLCEDADALTLKKSRNQVK
jgi:anaerobic magnesium-protoporphyrin IX monomethyl ester cyclase